MHDYLTRSWGFTFEKDAVKCRHLCPLVDTFYSITQIMELHNMKLHVMELHIMQLNIVQLYMGYTSWSDISQAYSSRPTCHKTKYASRYWMPTRYVAKNLEHNTEPHIRELHSMMSHITELRVIKLHTYSYTSWGYIPRSWTSWSYVVDHTGLLSSQKEVYQMLLKLLKHYQCSTVKPSTK